MDVPFMSFHVQEWTGAEWRTIAVFWRECDARFFVEQDETAADRDVYRIVIADATEED